MLKTGCILFLGGLAFCAEAQIVRQESTNELKKAVYTVNVAGCPQRLVESYDQGNYSIHYWAMVAVPELTLSSSPSIELRKITSDDLSGWKSGLNSDEAVISEKMIYLWWMSESLTSDGQYYSGAWMSDVQIIVVYESKPQPEPSLKVINTGTGKSLALEWSTNAPNAKVEGYKVYRRNVTE